MKKLLSKFVIFVVLLGVLVSGWLFMDMKRFLSSPMALPEEGVVIEVQPGSNLTRIANDLSQQNIINKPSYLRWYARWQEGADKIHTGEYKIEPGTSPREFLAMLIAGKVLQYSITIVEGWTFKQMMQAINENPSLSHELAGLSDEEIMTKLGYKGQHPEGRFLPDTYAFPRGMSDIAFLNRAYQAMEDYLAQRWPDRDVGIPVKSPYEVLILASIVEKETGLASERKAIAGVFSRRLQKRMRLQTDPTVIYGMGDSYKGNIRKRDLLEDTPYNTYRIFGLPPTPIAMPGRDAIDAVLHPAEGNELYFVSKGDGSHHFSATLEEHNEAVIKYQLKGKRKAFSSFKPEEENKK
jgi:UPF0755 protein